MIVLTVIVLSVAASIAGEEESYTPLEFGMEMSNKAYGIVCWYENLKVFPITHGDAFLQCQPGLDHVIKGVHNPGNQDYFKMYPEKKETWFGENVPQEMAELPSEYKTNCEQYLADRNAAPPADESDAINDQGNTGYPYRAFAYCMMKTLRDKHGDKAIEAVKSEKTHSLQHWTTVLNQRENEFRARHGAKPLKAIKPLMDAAQAWADENARVCRSYHTEKSQRLWKGKNTGENIFAGGGSDTADIAAYQAVDGWYEEINNYPFPAVYNGKNGRGVVGHFTQTVWKESNYVGYGYAYNPKCAPYTKYIVARYSPAGNMQGAYGQNVDPPKD